ncbi:hypothetical protein DV737_g4608, partial [Chaetothyriales sp. CBS 132003]
MAWTSRVCLLPLLAALSAGDTGLSQEIVSAFVYTMYGDRTPFVFDQNPTLTPLGAQQLYQAGASIRARYVTPTLNTGANESATIQDISPYQILDDEISVYSTDDQWVVASAQAFMQGLYPPLESSSNYTYISGLSYLANGTNVVAPLNGYQYATIHTASTNDLDSMYLKGSTSCPIYTEASAEYYTSSFYQALEISTAEFYASLEPQFLSGIFSDASVGYFDAYYIWDYLNYAYLHNTTVANSLDEASLTRASILAADWAFAMNTNTSLSGLNQGDQIGVMAGKTLAYRILQAFYTTINTQGTTNKLTLAFGSYEPMIAFAALSQLISPTNAAFYNLPAPGASFIFELLTFSADEEATYPSVDDLFVRFLYINGTGDYSDLVAYSLFGYTPSEDVIPLSDFLDSMQQISISSVEEWCYTCASVSIFCAAFANTTSDTDDEQTSSQHHGLRPAVAGVIGAAVTLVFVGLVLAAIMLFGGFRLHRRPNKRRSELGGFKGAEKLASDQDLTLPKGRDATDVAHAGAGAGAGTAHPPGHERVGSWELRDQDKAQEAQRSITEGHTAPRRPSFEDDELQVNPFGPAIKPHESV